MKKGPNAVYLGRLGGLKGGPARAAALSPEQRAKAARKAARERWCINDLVALYRLPEEAYPSVSCLIREQLLSKIPNFFSRYQISQNIAPKIAANPNAQKNPVTTD